MRVPVEADVEYRFVKASYLAWQATGDEAWMKRMLPHCERALAYVLTDPWRWDRKHRLVKRAYTIDTWDFDYTAGRHDWLNFQITDDTFWGIMHGDSSGYYQAFQQMALMYGSSDRRRGRRTGRRSPRHSAVARTPRASTARSTRTRFRSSPAPIDGVDEEAQLSLSNPMDINRGLATMRWRSPSCDEYQRRGERSGTFADGSASIPRSRMGSLATRSSSAALYCNGGIMPLVGGELARAAFEHGLGRVRRARSCSSTRN